MIKLERRENERDECKKAQLKRESALSRTGVYNEEKLATDDDDDDDETSTL